MNLRKYINNTRIIYKLMSIIIISALVASTIAIGVQTTTVIPIDGHYKGNTSQNQSIEFDTVSGRIINIAWGINPICSGNGGGFGGWEAQYYGDMFTWNYNVIQKSNGDFDSIKPFSDMFVLGSGMFDTPTHAKGQIMHGRAYFTGNTKNKYQTSKCIDNNITFEVNYTGPPVNPYQESTKYYKEDYD